MNFNSSYFDHLLESIPGVVSKIFNTEAQDESLVLERQESSGMQMSVDYPGQDYKRDDELPEEPCGLDQDEHCQNWLCHKKHEL